MRNNFNFFIILVLIFTVAGSLFATPYSCDLEVLVDSSYTLCFGDSLLLEVGLDVSSYIPPFYYLIYWDDGDSTRDSVTSPPWEFSEIHTFPGGGVYNVDIYAWPTDPDTCADTAAVIVTVSPLLVVDAGPDRWVYLGDTVNVGGVPAVMGGLPPYSFSWAPSTYLTDPNISNPGAFPISNTTYILTVTDSLGCSGTDTVFVQVDNPPDISNVDFWQATDGSQLVTICYALDDPDGDSVSIHLNISSDGGSTWGVPVGTVYDTVGIPPNLGSGVLPGTHCFVWDLGADLPGVEDCDFVVQITAQAGLNETLSVLDSFLLPEARGITFDGTYLWVNQSPGIPPPDSADKIFKINPYTYARLDSFYYPSFPYGHMEDMAWVDDTLYLFGFGLFAPSVRARIFKIDTSTGLMVDTSLAIYGGTYTGQGLTSDGVNLLANDSRANIYKIDPHTLVATFMFTADTASDGDTVIFAGHNSDGSAFGLGSLFLSRNGWGYRIFQVDTTLGIIVDSFAAPFSGTDTGPEGLAFDGRYFWYAENSLHGGTVYKLGTHLIEVSGTSSPGCLDSRDPEVTIDSSICDDSLRGGTDYTFIWEVLDSFVFPHTPCSLYISYNGGLSYSFLGLSSNDSSFLWSPVIDTLLSNVIFGVLAVDSFGNSGFALSCGFNIIEACDPMDISIVCPNPCGIYSSCPSQPLVFYINDTTGIGIDTMNIFFTLYIYHSSGGADTIIIHEPSDYLSFPTDTIMGILYSYRDGDSVVITLDSVYNIDACLVTPPTPLTCSFMVDLLPPEVLPGGIFPAPGTVVSDTVNSIFVNLFDDGAGVLDDSTYMIIEIWNDPALDSLFYSGDSAGVDLEPGDSVTVCVYATDDIPYHPSCSCEPNSLEYCWSFRVCRTNNSPLVWDVEFFQRTDGSRVVDIYFYTNDEDGDSLYIDLLISSDGGLIWDIIPSTFMLPSDTGWVIPSASEVRHIIWDMGAEYSECDFEESDIRVMIIADDRAEWECE